MLKHINRLLFLLGGLCILSPILLICGYPLGMNRFPFESVREHYPCSVTITATSFPFEVYCDKLFNSRQFMELYDDANVSLHELYYNSDTLLLICKKEGEDKSDCFMIVESASSSMYNSMHNCLLLDEMPDYEKMINRGFKHKHLNWLVGIISFLLEPVVFALIVILCLLILSLKIYTTCVSGKRTRRLTQDK